ncbi:MAG: tripartite tricarboxylate transporter substrate binding protein [Proteobacteria bacterium]|nr:tripartite tricarboxylate transporter substrate binding protein [Pseudomonadota bacterium]
MQLKLSAVVASALFLASNAFAVYPERPIRLVVPAAPGGAIDVVGRIVGFKLTELLGTNVLIDNRAGANNIIGTEIVARAQPDGHTLLITAGAHTINPVVYKKLPYDTLRDFEPISHIANSGGLVVVVHPSSSVKSIPQLIDAARANPGKLVYGSAGIGNSMHLAGELFQMLAGVKLTHVPYKGGGPAVSDLLGGQIHLVFGGSPTVMPMVKAGKLRPLAFTGRARSRDLPDVPTVEEAGVTGFEMSGWYGLYAPRGTSKAIVVQLSDAIRKVVEMSDTRERFAALNLEPVGSSPQEFGAFLRKDIEKYEQIARKAGIVPQ